MAKTVTLRIDEETYRKFLRQAEQERRSLGKFIENAVMRYTEHNSFADDEEMRGIMNDEGLLRRMKQGIRDAKSGRGKLVA
jgi:hypothetical protein